MSKEKSGVILILVASFAMIQTATCSPGLAISGPQQEFKASLGENITSYIRVYNEGNSSGLYRVGVEGEGSRWVIIREELWSLEPGENRKIPVTYGSPPAEGSYAGKVVVSVEGPQIIPLASREFNVTFTKPVHQPRLSIVFPKDGETVSGEVHVAVEVLDSEQGPINIFVDDELVSHDDSFTWSTSEWKNGEHTIRAELGDGDFMEDCSVTVYVRNEGKSLIPAVGSAILIACSVPLFFAFRKMLQRKEE